MSDNLSDFHVHTKFCDGKNTPEEMIQAALKLGMKQLGFSGHAHVSFDEESTMSIEGTEKYKREIRELATKYKNEIKILCGVEQDYYSDLPLDDYDYVIGSVHTLFFNGPSLSAFADISPRGGDFFTSPYRGGVDEIDGEVSTSFVHVDMSADALREAVNKYCNGDFYSLIELYYDYEVKIIEKIKNKNIKNYIIGHFDLITKFNENGALFDENNKRYIDAAFSALDELLKTGCPFEINTGAMSRGYRTSPYPSVKILKRIAEKGGSVILSSDSHDINTLCYKFKECEELAKSLGLKIQRALPPL